MCDLPYISYLSIKLVREKQKPLIQKPVNVASLTLKPVVLIIQKYVF